MQSFIHSVFGLCQRHDGGPAVRVMALFGGGMSGLRLRPLGCGSSTRLCPPQAGAAWAAEHSPVHLLICLAVRPPARLLVPTILLSKGCLVVTCHHTSKTVPLTLTASQCTLQCASP